jgi:glycosidase
MLRNEIERALYDQEPDFTRPHLEIDPETMERMLARLSLLYGGEKAAASLPELVRVMNVHHAHKPSVFLEIEKQYDPQSRFSEKDFILITYGDLLETDDRSPLSALAAFLERPRMEEIFNTLHLLPFFPYSSDRGFSVTDYQSVDPNLGSWQDIEDIGQNYRLMFDGVFNHISAQSKAFREFLSCDPAYKDVVIAYDSPEALTKEQRAMLLRPRTSDILSQYQSLDGPVWVWTTFSADQIDLNFKNPLVLIYVIETLLLYVRRGADIVRLDAVTYLWAEPGTSSAHLKQTHEIIKLLRDVLDICAPQVTLLTETNVPHKDNISYFGNGYDEAQMVYNFALPPLVLHTFYSGNSSALTQWAAELEYPTDSTSFLNMLDTHDGVGLLGARGYLSDDQIKNMVQKARDHGALIGYRTGPGGTDEPYEINSTWYCAINQTASNEPLDLKVKRYTASRSVACMLKGVPAVYFHGLIGSVNDMDTVLRTKHKRDINRQVIHESQLFSQFKNPESRVHKIIQSLFPIFDLRVRHPAFHPLGGQKVLNLSPQVFSLLRTSLDGKQHVLALVNVSSHTCHLGISLEEIGLMETHWYDMAQRRGWSAQDGRLSMELDPYDISWLVPMVELERAIEETS